MELSSRVRTARRQDIWLTDTGEINKKGEIANCERTTDNKKVQCDVF